MRKYLSKVQVLQDLLKYKYKNMAAILTLYLSKIHASILLKVFKYKYTITKQL